MQQSRDDTRRGKTGWARLDALSDAEIAEAVRRDPDAVPLGIDWSKAVVFEPPAKRRKKRIASSRSAVGSREKGRVASSEEAVGSRQ